MFWIKKFPKVEALGIDCTKIKPSLLCGTRTISQALYCQAYPIEGPANFFKSWPIPCLSPTDCTPSLALLIKEACSFPTPSRNYTPAIMGIKDYSRTLLLVCRFPIQLWQTIITPPPAPPALAPATVDLPDTTIIIDLPPPPPLIRGGGRRQEDFEWSKLIIAFCFSSAIEMAVQLTSAHNNHSLQLQMLSLAISLAFASLFVAKFIHSKFPFEAYALEQAAVLFAATAFFLAISLPFPLYIKCTSLSVFAASVLAILICNHLR